MQSRISWTGTVLLLGFLGLIASLARRSSQTSASRATGSYTLRHWTILLGCVGVSYLAAELVAVLTTYAEPRIGFLGEFESLVAAAGSILFPVVAKYHEFLSATLGQETVLKVQAIVSAFLFAGVGTSCAMAINFMAMPTSDRKEFYRKSRRPKVSTGFIIFGVPFSMLMAASAFFGWFEFDGQLPTSYSKFCPVKAPCYASGDDLVIFAAATMKALVIFGFPLGALVAVDQYHLLAEK
jgi:hypothetical protein